jgi:protein-L-isoaspartate(D-aspartate) O-methyltransferase
MAVFPMILFSGACSDNKTGGSDNYIIMREIMVSRQIAARGVADPRVLDAMLKVPRHIFVPEKDRSLSYDDTPLPIGAGQTISQPYIVAFMTEALKIKQSDKILEIGTGSGYQAAVLCELAGEVFSVEIIPELAERAEKTLGELGYKNFHIKTGDGWKGWPEEAPFDAIIVTAAPPEIPPELIEQLWEGGRIIVPVGSQHSAQNLILGTKKNGRLETVSLLPVRFVPMVKE